MKIAIMQPYFFPYIGYFSLIKNTDYFVFFDTPQYIRKGWINRNRILSNEGIIYITVPVEKAKRETPIKDIRINYTEPWRDKILGRMDYYKNKAPFYKSVRDVVEESLMKSYEGISELAVDSVLSVCKYLGMDINYSIFSNMHTPTFSINGPDEWALNITKYLGYDTYVNPPGGKRFFDEGKYADNNIKLQFLSQELVPYKQKTGCFQPGLSILDVMMFCEKEEIVQMMSKFTVE